MHISDAADICHAPYLLDRRTADIMRDQRQFIADALAKGYPHDLDVLMTVAINGEAFLRGMVDGGVLLDDVRLAQAKLALMVEALS